MKLTRRTFINLGTASVAGGALPSSLAALPTRSASTFRFAVVADTHIIDEYYKPGSENGAEDNQSILLTTPRLIAARDTINAAHPLDGRHVEQVFIVGDCFHNYPSPDLDFYYKNRTRIDLSRELFDGFHAPVHLGFGNHDYDTSPTPGISRAQSHQLFRDKLRTPQPYYALDYKGFRFLHLNNFLGTTWDPASPDRNHGIGSLGEVQLQWLEAQLAAHKPTVVFIHYPLWFQQPTEFADFGLHPLLQKYKDTIRVAITGHYHKWIDFAHTYGPRHIVMASTRYDQNAFMLFDADPTGQVRWIDDTRPQWSTHYATPYRG